jgi:hypothetical protein
MKRLVIKIGAKPNFIRIRKSGTILRGTIENDCDHKHWRDYSIKETLMTYKYYRIEALTTRTEFYEILELFSFNKK